MEHPVLAEDMKSILIYEKGFSTLYDIVWSFDYYLENITNETEFGFVFFLQDSNVEVKSESSGIDLGYSSKYQVADIFRPDEISQYLTPTTGAYFRIDNVGLAGGLLGVGFDSTGCFALSTGFDEQIFRPDGVSRYIQPGGVFTYVTKYIIRDGKDDSERIPNSVSVRGPAPEYSPRKYYSYNDYSINYALTNFPIVDSVKKTVRARLGNLGRTFYVDYRRTPEEQFINIFKQDVTLPDIRYRSATSDYYAISGVDLVRPGITFTRPVSSASLSAIPRVVIENFHVEGKTANPSLDFGTQFKSLTAETVLETPVMAITSVDIPPLPDVSPLSQPPVEPYSPQYLTEQNNSAGTKTSIISSFITGYNSTLGRTPDIFNFGYTLSAGGYDIPPSTLLYRLERFKYQSIDGNFTLLLTSFNSTWTLSLSGTTLLTGNNLRPVNTYTETPGISSIRIIYL